MKQIAGFTKFNKELLNILTKIKSERLMEDFLCDILTPNEYDNLVTRLQIIKQLNAGISQRTVAKNLNVSISKITRGAREMRDKNGGFKQVLKLLKEKRFNYEAFVESILFLVASLLLAKLGLFYLLTPGSRRAFLLIF